MGCCKHGNTDGDCLRCEEEFAESVEAENSRGAKMIAALEAENAELRAALYDEHHGITHSLRVALFEEAVEAILNLAPAIRKERGGCFGSRQADCGCTVCKVRRYLALERPNVKLTGGRDHD